MNEVVETGIELKITKVANGFIIKLTDEFGGDGEENTWVATDLNAVLDLTRTVLTPIPKSDDPV